MAYTVRGKKSKTAVKRSPKRNRQKTAKNRRGSQK